MIGIMLIAICTIILLILGIIFKPEIKIGKFHVETFWLVSVLGAAFLFPFGYVTVDKIYQGITNSGAMNPLKILVIFITMTILSVVLDELGFFRKLAYLALQKAKTSQIRIFIYLYVTISILTVFTSNDIIILTFTPFICYFTKNAKINPIPYLISEFVAANTWSMMLVIGNPTNIYLASIYQVNFFAYFLEMALPTIVSALGALVILLLLFRKDLKKSTEIVKEDYVLKNPKLVAVAVSHLALCTLLLSVSSYLNLEMWYISLAFAVSILLILFLYQRIIRKEKPIVFQNSLKRAPWTLIPFLLSMFTIVLALSENGITAQISGFLDRFDPIYGYGISSFLIANVMNNIPMTIFFADLIHFAPAETMAGSIYAAIIGSNLGAYLTPIGALAGIMWMRILKRENIPLSFLKFMKYGILISVPTILIALFVLSF